MRFSGMKTNNKHIKIDERNRQIGYRVISVMYFITIFTMQMIILYRQFVLGQQISEFEDLAILVTINSVFLISALLYFGAVSIRRMKIKTIIGFYFLFVILGTIFTYFKYFIFTDNHIPIQQFITKIFIVAAIVALLMSFWVIMSVLGNKRTEKELE